MKKMKFFLDTHDAATDTFPRGLTPQQFEAFFSDYVKICEEEGVVVLRVHVAQNEDRAFCFTMAPDENAVRRAHERVNLPVESISEVRSVTPGDIFFKNAHH